MKLDVEDCCVEGDSVKTKVAVHVVIEMHGYNSQRAFAQIKTGLRVLCIKIHICSDDDILRMIRNNADAVDRLRE